MVIKKTIKTSIVKPVVNKKQLSKKDVTKKVTLPIKGKRISAIKELEKSLPKVMKFTTIRTVPTPTVVKVTKTKEGKNITKVKGKQIQEKKMAKGKTKVIPKVAKTIKGKVIPKIPEIKATKVVKSKVNVTPEIKVTKVVKDKVKSIPEPEVLESKVIKSTKGKSIKEPKVIPRKKVKLIKDKESKVIPEIKEKSIPKTKESGNKKVTKPVSAPQKDKPIVKVNAIEVPFNLETALMFKPETQYISEYAALIDKYNLNLDQLEIEYLQKARNMFIKYKTLLEDPIFKIFNTLYTNIEVGFTYIREAFPGKELTVKTLLSEFQSSLKAQNYYLDFTMMLTAAPLPVLHPTDSTEDFYKSFYSYLDSCYYYLS